MHKYLLFLSLFFVNINATINVNESEELSLKLFAEHSQSAYQEVSWELTNDRLEDTSKWSYDGDSFYNETEAHFFTNTDSLILLSVSYEIANSHRYKSEISAYNIGISNESIRNFYLYDNANYMLNNSLNFLYRGRYFYSSYYDTTQAKGIDNYNFSARTSLIHNHVKNIALKALYIQVYRVPTYYEKEVCSSTVIGKPNLTPKLSQTYDLILLHELESFNNSIGLITRLDIGSVAQKNDNICDINNYRMEFNTKFIFDDTFCGFENHSHIHPEIKTNLAVSKLLFEEYLINTSIKYLDDF